MREENASKMFTGFLEFCISLQPNALAGIFNAEIVKNAVFAQGCAFSWQNNYLSTK